MIEEIVTVDAVDEVIHKVKMARDFLKQKSLADERNKKHRKRLKKDTIGLKNTINKGKNLVVVW